MAAATLARTSAAAASRITLAAVEQAANVHGEAVNAGNLHLPGEVGVLAALVRPHQPITGGIAAPLAPGVAKIVVSM